MKPAASVYLLISALSICAAFGQSTPKIAIAAVELNPVLAKKLTTSGPVDANFIGSWRGNSGVLTIVFNRTSDSASVSLANSLTTGHANAVVTGLHMHAICQMQGGRAPWILDGSFIPSTGVIKGSITLENAKRSIPMLLYRATGISASADLSRPLVDLVTLALNTRLIDQFQTGRSFTVMEDADLKQAVSLNSGIQSNFKDPAIVDQFKKAGIDYLLFTSLEDVADQTVDLPTLDNQRRKRPAVATQGQVGATIKEQKAVRITVRSKLFNMTGDLMESVSHTFTTNRIYAALATGNNMESTSDLYELAAREMAEWLATHVSDIIFPIKVLDKKEGQITLNRGANGGLKLNQTFNIYTLGKELKDPTTGEVLGRDEIKVGKVVITDVQDKFAKARVADDKGIIAGAVLRRGK